MSYSNSEMVDIRDGAFNNGYNECIKDIIGIIAIIGIIVILCFILL